MSPVSHYLLVFISVLSLSRVTEAQAAPVIFYPFGSVAGDTANISIEDENSTLINLWSPFVFFGRMYNRTYQYSNGSVLTRATQDINQYFPGLNFTANWVLVATWDRVAYYYHSGTETSFQVVLISGSDLSFILINYGDCAVGYNFVQAGYDTINSTAYFKIPGSDNGSFTPNLKNSTNVNVPGRWAFRVEGGPDQNNLQENIIGIQMRVTSFSDLRESANIETVLEKLQQELIKYGLPNSVKLKLRRVQKTQP
ncbi:hypothetical protein cypCar_00045452 [Cyprinus carpio]|nr:hypothetical protein cypCar_00045452 [Cyprinus carpio]